MVETAAHLNQCASEARTELLEDSVDELQRWMLSEGRTNIELTYWIVKYILFRGTKRMAKLGPMSMQMRDAAESQDLIGWREFMEGKISYKIDRIQQLHSATSISTINGDDWSKQFISKLLQVSHSQWVFRNTTLHDAVRGTIKLQRRREVLQEIERLAEVDPDEVAQESRFLLEMDFSTLTRAPVERQSYWVYAMRAAWKAGKRRAGKLSKMGRRERLVTTRREKKKPVFNFEKLNRQLRSELDLRQSSRSARLVNVAGIETQNKPNKRLKKPD